MPTISSPLSGYGRNDVLNHSSVQCRATRQHAKQEQGHSQWHTKKHGAKRKKSNLHGKLGLEDDEETAGTKMREQLANGLDPLRLKRTEEHKPSIPTFEAATREVHSKLLPGWKNPKHGKQWISTLE